MAAHYFILFLSAVPSRKASSMAAPSPLHSCPSAWATKKKKRKKEKKKKESDSPPKSSPVAAVRRSRVRREAFGALS